MQTCSTTACCLWRGGSGPRICPALTWPLPRLAHVSSPCLVAPSQDEGGQSVPFVQKLWEQYMVEKDEYLNELKQELGLEL